VGTADAYTALDWYGVLSTRDSNPHAFAAAQAALRIDPELAEAHASLALARQYRGSGAGSKSHFVARSRSTHTSNVTALADVAKVSLNPGALALGSTSWIRAGPGWSAPAACKVSPQTCVQTSGDGSGMRRGALPSSQNLGPATRCAPAASPIESIRVMLTPANLYRMHHAIVACLWQVAGALYVSWKTARSERRSAANYQRGVLRRNANGRYTILLPASAIPGWPSDVVLPSDPVWKRDYAGSVRRLVRDGVDVPLASLFVHAARTVSSNAEGADRARSATEAFLYRRLETLAETKGRFRVNTVLPIAFDGFGALEVDLLCADARVAVELDGDQHLADPAAYRRDRRKDQLLQENGYFVLRFLAEDVGRELDSVLDAILRALAHRQTCCRRPILLPSFGLGGREGTRRDAGRRRVLRPLALEASVVRRLVSGRRVDAGRRSHAWTFNTSGGVPLL